MALVLSSALSLPALGAVDPCDPRNPYFDPQAGAERHNEREGLLTGTATSEPSLDPGDATVGPLAGPGDQLTSLPTACCDACAEVGQVCALLPLCHCELQEPDDSELYSAHNASFGDIMRGEGRLQEGAHAVRDLTFHLCRTHFPPPPNPSCYNEAHYPQYHAAELAIRHFCDMAMVDLTCTIVSMTHRDKEALWDNANQQDQHVYIEYVDNSAGTPDVFPCHASGQTSSWSMNACISTRNLVGPTGFIVSVNQRYYDGSMDDYPSHEGLAHEIGHGFGMVHEPYWDLDDRLFSGVMGGANVTVRTAVDTAFMRHYYPLGDPYDTHFANLVASNETRVYAGLNDNGNPAYDRLVFDEDNPQHLYLDANTGEYYDCEHPHEDAVFYTEWFNIGTGSTRQNASSSDGQIIQRLTIEDGSDVRVIRAWPAAEMTRETQDQWSGAITIPERRLSGLPTETGLTLRFTIDAFDQVDENRESDNEQAAEIWLYASRTDCP